MLTYQDFEKARASGGVPAFIGKLLGEHAGSSMVQTARTADEYDHQRNVTIREYAAIRYTAKGERYTDFTSSLRASRPTSSTSSTRGETPIRWATA